MKWFVTASTLTLATLVACGGGDDSNGGGDQNDASTNDAAIGDGASGGDANASDGSTGAPTAVAGDVDVYVGQLAKLDASASTPAGATFQWLLGSVPGGSTISSASITNADTATPSFTPDVGGAYQLTLKVTAGGQSATKNVKVTAYPGKVAFMTTQKESDGGFLSAVSYTATDGTGASNVGCVAFDQVTGIPEAYGLFYASSIDWREGNPADDPQIVWGGYDNFDDGGVLTYLAATKSRVSVCGTANLAKLDPVVNPPSFGIPRLPRLSPSGARIAYVKDSANGPIVSTIGFDGSNPRFFGSEVDADAAAGDTVTRAIRWVSETEIAWIVVNGANWSIVHANDASSGAPVTDMTCSTAVPPNEFDILADGSYLVSVGTFADGGLATAASNEVDLVVLKPDGSGACTTVRNLSKATTGSAAEDFALSPDRTRVAFLLANRLGDGGTQTGLFVAPVDGSAAPAQPTGAPVTGAFLGSGPRWVSGGSALAWGQGPGSVAANQGQTVAVLPVAGGALSTLVAAPDGGPYATAAGNVQLTACDVANVGFGGAGAVTGIGSMIAAVGLVFRRRRKKNGDS